MACLEDLAAFHCTTGVPVALDESVDDATRRAMNAGTSIAAATAEFFEPTFGVVALVLKPSVLGGFEPCAAAAAAARNRGVAAVVSAAFESGVGVAACAPRRRPRRRRRRGRRAIFRRELGRRELGRRELGRRELGQLGLGTPRHARRASRGHPARARDWRLDRRGRVRPAVRARVATRRRGRRRGASRRGVRRGAHGRGVSRVRFRDVVGCGDVPRGVYASWDVPVSDVGFDPDAATSPSAILLHGFMGAAEDWNAVAAGLAGTGRRIVAVDLPAHGGTAFVGDPAEGFTIEAVADAVARLVARETTNEEEKKAPAPAVIGYSLGARVALRAAAGAPGRVSGRGVHRRVGVFATRARATRARTEMTRSPPRFPRAGFSRLRDLGTAKGSSERSSRTRDGATG